MTPPDAALVAPPASVEGLVTQPDVAPSVRDLLERPKAERIALARGGRWILYPRATNALAQLRYVLEQPKSSRMTGLTLVGPTNNGKTTIVREFIRANKHQDSEPEAERHEFLLVQTPPVPSVSLLYSEILRSVNDLKADKGTTGQKLSRVLHILPELRLRMLFLDEIHNVLAGSPKQSEGFLNTLKFLSNHLQIPVVLIGTEAASHVIRTDAQVLNRYPPYTLALWEQGEAFNRLVSSVLSTFPLRRRSELPKTSIAHLHMRSQGALGTVVQTLQRAAVWAIEHGVEEVTPKVLEAIEFG